MAPPASNVIAVKDVVPAINATAASNVIPVKTGIQEGWPGLSFLTFGTSGFPLEGERR